MTLSLSASHQQERLSFWFTSRSLRRRIAIGVHRDTSVNRGAMLELRLNEQLAVHQFYALLHTG